MKALAFLPLLLLTACHERIVYRDVFIPVPAKCVPESVRAEVEYPDTDEALIKAGDAADRYQLVIVGRALRKARLAEIEPVIAKCP